MKCGKVMSPLHKSSPLPAQPGHTRPKRLLSDQALEIEMVYPPTLPMMIVSWSCVYSDREVSAKNRATRQRKWIRTAKYPNILPIKQRTKKSAIRCPPASPPHRWGRFPGTRASSRRETKQNVQKRPFQSARRADSKPHRAVERMKDDFPLSFTHTYRL